LPEPPLVEPLRRWDPEQVGGYVLLGRLGSGAMGQVYLGRSTAGRLVAVKTIKAELAEEPDFRNQFGQEVAAARRVSGAFTAAVIAADSEADVPWLATVYVPAPSLSRLVRSCGPIPVPAVRWLAAGCAEALESIHSVGLVHRDLKPANVLVSPDGPRVIDFGVARAAERIQLTVTRGGVGTPAYMAPEQARDTRQATSASDIFALGATMLFAATGHAPYQGETVMDVLVQLATGPPDLTGLPLELVDIVVACLERDPRNRPTSASVLARLAPELAAGGDIGIPPLPSAALQLIEEYSRLPRSAAELSSAPARADGWPSPAQAEALSGDLLNPAGNAATGADDTMGSQPLAAKAGWAPVGLASGGLAAGGLAAGGLAPAGRARTGVNGVARWRRPRLARRITVTVAIVAVAAGLFGVGLGAGRILRTDALGDHPSGGRDARKNSGSASPNVSLPPAASGLGCARPGTGAGRLGPLLGRPSGIPPPGGLPPGQAPRVIDPKPGVPYIALSQPTGDSYTGFVVHGGNWPRDAPVTIELVGCGNSAVPPIADRQGTFNYVINQDDEFFRDGLPAGLYTVRAVDAAGRSASARFEVIDQ
jgi:serine/threonine protein kinase